MDTVAGMRIFTRVVDAGSFSAAGRQLGMAPSSISRHIGELESDLGTQLFYRTTRKLSLTEAGRLYHARAAQILIDVDDARRVITQAGSAPGGVLRVSVPTIARPLVSTGLPIFLARYPALQVVVEMTDSLVDIVDEGIDLAIRIGRQRDSSLIARKIYVSRRVICASPRYLDKAGAPQHPSELEQHNCLTFRTRPGKNLWRFRGPDGISEARVSGSLFADSADLLATAAVSGLGLILLPDLHIVGELASGSLVPVLKSYHAVPENSPIYAVYPQQRHVPPKVRAFVDFLVEHFAAETRNQYS